MLARGKGWWSPRGTLLPSSVHPYHLVSLGEPWVVTVASCPEEDHKMRG